MYNVFFAALLPLLRKISYLMEQPNLYNSKAFQVLMSFPSQWIGTQGPYDFPDRTEPHRNIILDTRRTKKFSNMFPKLCGVKKEHSVLIYAEVFASMGCFHLTQLSSLFFPRLLILSLFGPKAGLPKLALFPSECTATEQVISFPSTLLQRRRKTFRRS